MEIKLVKGNVDLINDYYKKEALNQSLIKQLENGPFAYLDALSKSEQELKYYEEKEHFLIGTGVDDKITMPVEYAENKYYVSQGNNKPSSENIMSIIKKATDEYLKTDNAKYLKSTIDYVTEAEMMNRIFAESIAQDEKFRMLLYNSINYHEYYSNRKKDDWKLDGRLDTVMKDNGVNYIFEIVSCNNKKIITLEEKEKIDSIYLGLLSNENTCLFLGRKTINVPSIYNYDDEIKIFYQVPFYFEVELQGEKIQCKALLDFVILNYTQKKLIPGDFKTTAFNTIDFANNIKNRRYDLQAAFYVDAVVTGYTPIQEIMDFKNNAHYKIETFKFVVESSKNSNPLLIETDIELYSAGKYGVFGNKPNYWSTDSEGNTIKLNNFSNVKVINKGYIELLSDFVYYSRNGFEQDKRITQSKTKGIAYCNFNELIFI